MAKIQSIKRRIRSVKNTKQITKAMELVSASKMRRAQEATLRTRPYSATAKEVLGSLVTLLSGRSHPLLQARPIQKRMLIVMTSDRGLAGAYNSNIFRLLLRELQESTPTKLIVIGNKGAQVASRLEGVELAGVYTDWPTAPIARDLRPILNTALNAFTTGEVDRVEVLYTEFISLIKQQATLEQLLPLQAPTNAERNEDLKDAEFEPSPEAVLNAVLPRIVESQLYQANLEAIASEHSMRMMAMKNASDNADDLIGDLTLTYNSARQASITQELAEITAGTEALK